MLGYYPPKFEDEAFSCPHCNVYAKQYWYDFGVYHEFENRHGVIDGGFEAFNSAYRYAQCSHCKELTMWKDEELIFPISSFAPPANHDMPDEVKQIYNEARKIAVLSPRGSVALLRLGLQILLPYVGGKGKNIYEDIRYLVKNGLDAGTQPALDTLRVIGNNAVHPGQINLSDDIETASGLFAILNHIVNVLITQPKELDEYYNSLPQSIRDEISKRDSN